MPSKKNKKELIVLKKVLEDYPIIGIINLHELPSMQLQKLRSKFKEKLVIRGTKKRILKLAITQLKEKGLDLTLLNPFLDNCVPALLLSKEDPFKIAKLITKNKSNAPAKAGQKAPFNLIVPTGPTPFAPGPIIGELGQLGIKTKVENGKLNVIQDVTVAKKDDIISFKVADLLTKLGITPMEIGLNLTAIYEKGQVYFGDTLVIDEKEYITKLKQASSFAFNLALNVDYPTKETIAVLLQKAILEANILESNLPKKDGN